MRTVSTILAFCVGALLAVGMVVLYSAGMNQPEARFLHMQLIWGGIGLVGCICASLIDYRIWKKWAIPLLIVVALLLVLVFVPNVGKRVNGANRWLLLGNFRIQPSEIAKIALLLFLAFYCEKYTRQMGNFWRGLVIPGAVAAGLASLIFLEPDAGTTVLCIALTGIILFLAGTRLWFLLPPIILAGVAFGFFLKYDPVRSSRIHAWLNPDATRLGVGMQSYQAKLALGSGGVTGIGLGEGRQKLGFVPEHHTDFIFSVIGEEMGLIATFSVLLAYLGFAVCGTIVAARACDLFGYLLAAGITFLISLQALINIGVVTGVLPNKGISLPFISYGGSNLLVMLFAVGVLFSIARLAAPYQRSRQLSPFAARDSEVEA